MSGFGDEAEILCSTRALPAFGEFRVAFEIEVALGGGAQGNAMQAYALVEGTQASIIEALLKVDFLRAHAILFAAQNARSRNELIETLLELEFAGTLRKFWASCSKYLLTLAQFRNALAHWHPYINIYTSKTEPKIRARPALAQKGSERRLQR
jgi:hypothetical protein